MIYVKTKCPYCGKTNENYMTAIHATEQPETFRKAIHCEYCFVVNVLEVDIRATPRKPDEQDIRSGIIKKEDIE